MNGDKLAMNKYIPGKYGGVIRRKFLNTEACRFVSSLPSEQWEQMTSLFLSSVSPQKEQIAAILGHWIW